MPHYKESCPRYLRMFFGVHGFPISPIRIYSLLDLDLHPSQAPRGLWSIQTMNTTKPEKHLSQEGLMETVGFEKAHFRMP